MRNVGDEIRLHGFDAAQLCDHIVEVTDHKIQVVCFLFLMQRLEPHGEISLGHLFGRFRDFLHRRFIDCLRSGPDQPGQQGRHCDPVEYHDMSHEDRCPAHGLHAKDHGHVDPAVASRMVSTIQKMDLGNRLLPAFAATCLIDHRLVAQTVDCLDLEVITVCQFSPELGHIHIHGTGPGGGIRIPEFIHQLLSGKGFFRTGQELIEDIELHRVVGISSSPRVAACSSRSVVNLPTSSRWLAVMFARRKGPRPGEAVRQVRGFGHVVIDPDPVTFLHGPDIVLRCHEKDRDLIVRDFGPSSRTHIRRSPAS